MTGWIKFLLMATVALAGIIGIYRVYRSLNQKITGSRNGWELFLYSLLLFLSSAFIFLATVYFFLLLLSSLPGSGL